MAAVSYSKLFSVQDFISRENSYQLPRHLSNLNNSSSCHFPQHGYFTPNTSFFHPFFFVCFYFTVSSIYIFLPASVGKLNHMYLSFESMLLWEYFHFVRIEPIGRVVLFVCLFFKVTLLNT